MLVYSLSELCSIFLLYIYTPCVILFFIFFHFTLIGLGSIAFWKYPAMTGVNNEDGIQIGRNFLTIEANEAEDVAGAAGMQLQSPGDNNECDKNNIEEEQQRMTRLYERVVSSAVQKSQKHDGTRREYERCGGNFPYYYYYYYRIRSMTWNEMLQGTGNHQD